MKLLFFTDPHLRGSTPRSRIDDYPTALEAKFDEIGQIIVRDHIDAVLNGGDLFDSPSPANSVVAVFTKKMRSWNVPIYSIIGSHDKYGYNDNTLIRTANGVLEAAGSIEIVNDPIELICMRPGELGGVFLCGTSHSFDLDTRQNEYVKIKPEGCRYMIQMAHGMLVDKPFFDKYTLLEKVAFFTESDLILSGHYHPGYGIIKLGNKTFINPGSLGRTEKTTRACPPSVVIIDTNTLDVKVLNLKSAVSDVFIETPEEQAFVNDVEVFIESLKSRIGTLETYSIKDLIIKVAEQEGVDSKIVERALRYVE